MCLKTFPSLMTAANPGGRPGEKPRSYRRDPERKPLPEYFVRAATRLGL